MGKPATPGIQKQNLMKSFKHLIGKIGFVACVGLLLTQTGCLPGMHGGLPGLPHPPGLPGLSGRETSNPSEMSLDKFDNQQSSLNPINLQNI
jgi:hypothetical protein